MAFALGAGIFVATVALAGRVNAASLRRGSSGSNSAVMGSLRGPVLWTHYENQLDGQFCPGTDPDGCNHESIDPVIRLINPNGAANGNLAGAKEQTVCAMIYVFDDDEEMGECCGCPLSSTQYRCHFEYLPRLRPLNGLH